MNEDIKKLISQADRAIKNEDFDNLMDFYTDDAVLIVKPGMIANGKIEIKNAFIAIAKYFNNSVSPTQDKMITIEAGDTVLVLSKTVLEAKNKTNSEFDMQRRATYVYRKIEGKWLCAIDNSYGTSLLD